MYRINSIPKCFLIATSAGLLYAASTYAGNEELVARGEYLVESIGGCGNCHTSRDANGEFIPGMNLAGGFLIEEPVFTSYAPNITPDPETGIGNWTDDEIARAIREGILPDGKVLGPPMPFPFYRDIADSDLRAMVAYLRTVPAVRNEVPRSEFRIPLPPAWGPPVEHVPDVLRDDPVAYGAYLAGPLGHCVDCHTPLVEGKLELSRLGAGGNIYPLGDGRVTIARNITSHPESGIGRWSDDEIKRAIVDGVRPDGTVMTPLMAFSMYRLMTDEDLDALVAYLRTLPPQSP